MLKDDNPKTAVGQAKPQTFNVPPSAELHLAAAFRDGVEKYGPFNWREKRVSISTYYGAARRHLMAYLDGQNFDPSGCHHLAHVMACCAILLDADSVGMLNDDRPTKGASPTMIEAMTKANFEKQNRPSIVGDPDALRRLKETVHVVNQDGSLRHNPDGSYKAKKRTKVDSVEVRFPDETTKTFLTNTPRVGDPNDVRLDRTDELSRMVPRRG